MGGGGRRRRGSYARLSSSGREEDEAKREKTVFCEAPATTWTTVTMASIVGTILTTYAFYVHQGGRKFLPTISATWERPPGNYLSRLFVGFGCDLLYPVAVCIFWARTTMRVGAEPDAAHERIRNGEGALLVMSLLAIFFLSWVPPICDSKAPTCRGNDDIHSFCAVTFFILFTTYAVVQIIETPHPRRPGEFCTDAALIGLSLLTKVRWLLPARTLDETPLAVLEWSDTSFICAWTTVYVYRYASPLSLGVVLLRGERGEAGGEEEAESAGPYISARVLRSASLGLCVLTLAATLAAGLLNGTLPKDHLPYISDMWVYPPGDWISRWGTIRGCTCAVLSQLMLLYGRGVDADADADADADTAGPSTAPSHAVRLAELGHTEAKHGGDGDGDGGGADRIRACVPPPPPPLPDVALTLLAIASFAGLSVVGSVGESEDAAVHSAAAIAFFVGYDLYMVLSLLRPRPGDRGGLSAAVTGWALAAVSVASKARWLSAASRAAPFAHASPPPMMIDIPTDVCVVLEWSDTLAMCCFMRLDVFRTPGTARIFGQILGVGRHRQDG